ncbi:MAG: hypothetical protein D6731_20955 [Planctomycetota bacterium]|nr:MAG: hypothetical protein D6731_20955 [Planctomycetota bacterium]
MNGHDDGLREQLDAAGEEERRAYREAARILAAASPLARATCPSAEDLLADPGELGAERAQARERHLAACPACRDDLRDFEALAAVAPAVAPAAARAVAAVRQVLVVGLDAAARALQVLESSLAPAPEPVLPAVRAREVAPQPALTRRAPFGAGVLELRLQRTARGVDLEARAAEGAPPGYRLLLRGREGEPLEVRAADAEGVVRLGALGEGAYELEVEPAEAEVPPLRVALELRAEN